MCLCARRRIMFRVTQGWLHNECRKLGREPRSARDNPSYSAHWFHWFMINFLCTWTRIETVISLHISTRFVSLYMNIVVLDVDFTRFTCLFRKPCTPLELGSKRRFFNNYCSLRSLSEGKHSRTISCVATSNRPNVGRSAIHLLHTYVVFGSALACCPNSF